MATSGRIAAALLGSAFFCGCGYFADRGRDFAEIWKADADFGVGLKGEARLGDILHLGVGGDEAIWRYGVDYGKPLSARMEEYLFPIAFIQEYADSGKGKYLLPPWWFIHYTRHKRSSPNWQTPDCDTECYGFLPLATKRRTRTLLHAFDVEASAFAVFLGLEFGFSPGELVDFLVGLATLDLDPKPSPRIVPPVRRGERPPAPPPR